ncbi:hypothetical protein ABK040_000254 [Willaertia magna]
MRLQLQQESTQPHKDVCTALGWCRDNQLYSISDDKQIWKWNLNGEPISKLCEVDVFVTDMHWFPSYSKKLASSTSDVFVISCSDGSFRLVSKSGRVEKTVASAHKGAVVTVRWNYEGSALVTAGEDGVIKIWSRGGQLRSTLASIGKCVYSLAWGPTNEEILFANEKDLVIKPIHVASKQIQWKAHDGVILKVDWNPLTNLIVSCGEEGRYKIWDSFGRLLYASSPFDYTITSVSWSPNGELFAVGSFNTLKICDKSGWTISRSTTNTGSITNISWTSDGTQLAASGGNGKVIFGNIVGKNVACKNLIVTLENDVTLKVHDLSQDYLEDITFRDKVINWSLGFGHLIVATWTQIWVYDVKNFSTPHVFDVKDNVNLILQSKNVFLTMDNFSGIQIYTYEGRLVSNPKFSGLRTEFLNNLSVGLSDDILAIIDKGDVKTSSIQILDVNTGKELDKIVHNMEIIQVSVSQFGQKSERCITFIDRNRDLYICQMKKPTEVFKLATMVDSAEWNDQTDLLAVVTNGQLVIFYYPKIVYVDRDLLDYIRNEKEEIGKQSTIQDFFDTKITIRRIDGAKITVTVNPYPIILYELIENKKWEQAIRLCRFVKEKALWATLIGMAIKYGQLNTAEVGLAAIEEVDKLQYIIDIRKIPSTEGRNAALALYMRNFDEAESILLQSRLTYRAIKMNIKLYRWDRALDLARKFKTHIDTVVAYRRKYLQETGQEETKPEFIQYSELEINWELIKEKIKQEKQKESNNKL